MFLSPEIFIPRLDAIVVVVVVVEAQELLPELQWDNHVAGSRSRSSDSSIVTSRSRNSD